MSSDISTQISSYLTLPDDIKTANILVSDQNGKTHIRLCFFPDFLNSAVALVLTELHKALDTERTSRASRDEEFGSDEIATYLTRVAPGLFRSTLYDIPFGRVYAYDEEKLTIEKRETLLAVVQAKVARLAADSSTSASRAG